MNKETPVTLEMLRALLRMNLGAGDRLTAVMIHAINDLIDHRTYISEDGTIREIKAKP